MFVLGFFLFRNDCDNNRVKILKIINGLPVARVFYEAIMDSRDLGSTKTLRTNNVNSVDFTR